MTPYELHQEMHEAMMQCPQFYEFGDDQKFFGLSQCFCEIPKGGYYAVISFWKEYTNLFDMGYDAALSSETQEILDNLDAIINDAINSYIKNC